MTLQWISIILGALATAGGLVGVLRPELIKKQAELFPRSVVPAWVFTGLCCVLGAKYAMEMNMGFLDAYKKFIYVLAPVVFFASVVYMKELLAPRALGGFLLLIAVPILRVASMDESSLRQVVVVLVYLWIVYGLLLLMSPWYFRKLSAPLLANDSLFKIVAFSKTAVGIVLLLLGIFVY